MDNLFIKLQKDKKIKRQFDILKSLSNGEVIAAEKLAFELNIHRATLASDIESLQLILPTEMSLTQDFRKGYQLLFPENNAIDYYIGKIARNTLVYQLIDTLFLQREADIATLAEKFFTSESVLERLITHMNTILKTYLIKITKHPLQFSGREADIRTFFFAFFRTFMDYYTLEPVDELFEQPYQETLDGLPYTTLHQNKAKVFLWTMISRRRIINHFFVTLPETLVAKISTQPSYQHYQKTYSFDLKLLKADFHLDELRVPEAEVMWAYLVALDCVVYVEKNEINSAQNDLYRPDQKSTDHDTLVAQLNATLLARFKLTATGSQQFALIVAYLLNIDLLSQASKNFQKVSRPLTRYIENNHPDIVKTWTELIKEPPFKKLAADNPQDLALTLSMLTIPLINDHLTGQLNILFSFETETGYSAVLVDASKLFLFPGVNALYVFSSAVTPEFIRANTIDVVIANYKQRNEDQLGCPVFHLSYLSTLAEWNQLRAKIIKSLR